MASTFRFICKCFEEIETALVNNLLHRFSPGSFAPALVNAPHFPQSQNPVPKFSLGDLLRDSFLWAVPKKRRSVQKVRSRRFGVPKYHFKPFVPKTNILVCTQCGGYKEAGFICGNCYEKVIKETNEIKEKIKNSLHLSPIEEEIVVLYDGEKEQDQEFWQGKRIIEMEKPRPNFFSRNLLQRTTQGNAETTEVQVVHVVKE